MPKEAREHSDIPYRIKSGCRIPAYNTAMGTYPATYFLKGDKFQAFNNPSTCSLSGVKWCFKIAQMTVLSMLSYA